MSKIGLKEIRKNTQIRVHQDKETTAELPYIYFEHLYEQFKRVTELEAQLHECNNCGFKYHKQHEDDNGGYTCPVCRESELEKEIEQLSEKVKELEEIQGKLISLEDNKHYVAELEQENKRLHNQLEKDFGEAVSNSHVIEAQNMEINRLRQEISFIANVDMLTNAYNKEHIATSIKSWALNVLEGEITMTKKLSSKELHTIRERVDKATKEPWRIGKRSPNGLNNVGTVDGLLTAQTTEKNDAIFISHARQDIPKLLAEVERLRSLISWNVSCSICVNQLAEDWEYDDNFGELLCEECFENRYEGDGE